MSSALSADRNTLCAQFIERKFARAKEICPSTREHPSQRGFSKSALSIHKYSLNSLQINSIYGFNLNFSTTHAVFVVVSPPRRCRLKSSGGGSAVVHAFPPRYVCNDFFAVRVAAFAAFQLLPLLPVNSKPTTSESNKKNMKSCKHARIASHAAQWEADAQPMQRYAKNDCVTSVITNGGTTCEIIMRRLQKKGKLFCGVRMCESHKL